MVGYFPSAYPDELLYSLCARTADRAKFPTARGLVEALYGTRRARANVAFPCRLEALISNLRAGHTYTVEKLISDHTLIPFYEPFLPIERVHRIRSMMAGDGRSSILHATGALSSGIKNPTHLRCCPECDAEDEKRYGTRYWHRLPQLAGIEVCPRHRVFFNLTAISRSFDRPAYIFISAEAANDQQPTRRIDRRNAQHKILLGLARDAEWLLGQNTSQFGPQKIKRLNLKLLQSHGVVTRGGISIGFEPFERRFRKFVTPHTLRLLQSELSANPRTSWLRRLVRQDREVQAPIRQLLFVQFFGQTIEKFLAQALNEPALERGPWPCLNPVCPRFRRLVVHSMKPERQNTVGVFSCSFCCMTYSRYLSRGDLFNTKGIRHRGWMWDRRFRQLMSDRSIKFKDIPKILGISDPGLRLYAARVGVPMRRHRGEAPTPRAKRDRRVNQLRDGQRDQWLTALSAHPDLGVTALRALHKSLYAFLWLYDREWLNRHKPPRAKFVAISGNMVDWAARDAEFAPRVQKIIDEAALDLEGRGQISRAAIGAKLGLALDRNAISRMPAVRKILETRLPTRAQVCESDRPIVRTGSIT